MAVTVGIATTGDSPHVLRETVEAVILSAKLVSDDAEVLVVVNGRDRVAELHGIDSPLLRVRYVDRRNVAVARNIVLAEARHDTILFTDDDCVVPREWCAQLTAAVREPGCPVVGAPVRLAVAGPVSAYFDYYRVYDAVPAGPDGPLLLVTANCGLRRDLIPASIRFDPRQSNAGEDTGFALALGKAGLPIRWLADATPVRHGFSEEVEEITERFMRYGSQALHMYLTHGHADAAMPGILGLYRQRVQDDFRLDRRFGEFLAAEARSAFAVYEGMAFASTIIGYLERFGAETDHPLLELDKLGLAGALREIGARVRERVAALSLLDWNNLRIDYSTMKERLGDPEPLLADVRRALRAHAGPIPVDPGGPVGDLLNHGLNTFAGAFMRSLSQVRPVFADLSAGAEPVTRDALDRAFRALGVPFKQAVDGIEFSLLFDFAGLLAMRASGQSPR